MNIEKWYYPRTEFAETVYRVLGKGPAEGVSIFGPRRTGKTSFLINDLMPMIEQNGHRVIYTSFWPARKSPLTSLLENFEESQRTESAFERVKSLAADFEKRIRLRLPGGAAEVEQRLPKATEQDLAIGLRRIDHYCKRFASDSKPAFLLFDEYQELEKAEFAESLIASLRTSIDIRKFRLRVVFAGSSQHRLRQMFTERDAPFFRYAFPLSMPPLDDRFVDFLIDEAKRA